MDILLAAILTERKTSGLSVHPANIVAPHNDPDNHVHIYIQHHAPVFRMTYSVHLVNEPGSALFSYFTASIASKIALTAELLFGALATYVTACDKIICASGIPIRSTACASLMLRQRVPSDRHCSHPPARRS